MLAGYRFFGGPPLLKQKIYASSCINALSGELCACDGLLHSYLLATSLKSYLCTNLAHGCSSLYVDKLMNRSYSWFLQLNWQDLNHALDRAINYFVQRREWWQDLVRKAMLMDFSWNSSAKQYEELYERAIAKARGAA